MGFPPLYPTYFAVVVCSVVRAAINLRAITQGGSWTGLERRVWPGSLLAVVTVTHRFPASPVPPHESAGFLGLCKPNRSESSPSSREACSGGRNGDEKDFVPRDAQPCSAGIGADSSFSCSG